MDPLGARSRRAREKGNLTIVNPIVKARAKGRAREAKAMSRCPPSLELKMTLFNAFHSSNSVVTLGVLTVVVKSWGG